MMKLLWFVPILVLGIFATVAPGQKPVVIGGGDEDSKSSSSIGGDVFRSTDLIPGRLQYVQVTDNEYKRIDLLAIYDQENHDDLIATGGPTDLPAYYGIMPLIIKPGRSGTVKRAGWLVPIQFIAKFQAQLKGNGGWDKLPADAPKPEWLKK